MIRSSMDLVQGKFTCSVLEWLLTRSTYWASCLPTHCSQCLLKRPIRSPIFIPVLGILRYCKLVQKYYPTLPPRRLWSLAATFPLSSRREVAWVSNWCATSDHLAGDPLCTKRKDTPEAYPLGYWKIACQPSIFSPARKLLLCQATPKEDVIIREREWPLSNLAMTWLVCQTK